MWSLRGIIVGVRADSGKQVRTLADMTEKSEQHAGPQLLLADARTAFLLANHARKRAIVRAFGVAPEDANAVTVAGLALLGAAVHEAVGPRLRRAVPKPGDALIGAGVGRSLLGAIVGPTLDEMPGVAALLAIALVARGARPTAVKSLQALRAGSHRASVEVHRGFDFVLGRP